LILSVGADGVTKDLNKILKEKGYRFTSQRQHVFEVLLENEGKHLNSQEIYELVQKKFPEIGWQLFTEPLLF
jgi:Fur family ferric uptake transcriptional regulator